MTYNDSSASADAAAASRGEIERLVAGQHHDPHSVLGAHPGSDGVTIRALRPLAASVTVVLPDGSRHPMTHLHQGVFEVTLPATHPVVPDYRLAVAYPGQSSRTTATDSPAPPASSELQDDPYRHLPTVGA
jgi:1,4-alpha-glucan branching enzyme